uniref:Coiled-coil domain containing 103 n=1 Tax=Eptatretus burgeri TaxID=7764 RepID=A0A8C4PVT1_EPTBU
MAGGSGELLELERHLEREMLVALAEDERKHRVNEAKFRAVTQAKTYEQFREIVLASHLKPLDKHDKVGGLPKQPWNVFASWRKMEPTSEKNVQVCCMMGKDYQLSVIQSAELHGMWRGLAGDPNERYSLLLDTGEKRLAQMFSTEVPFGLLGEILVALNDGFKDEDATAIYGLLWLLTRTPRSALNISFLSVTERDALQHLCTRLTAIAANTSIATTALREENENGPQPDKMNQLTSSMSPNGQPAGVDFSKKDLHNTGLVRNLRKSSFSIDDVENLKQSFSE